MTVPNPHRMFYVSAPCGSGKTFANYKYITEHQHLRNHLYIAPTKLLIDEQAIRFRERGIEPTIITSDTHKGNVTTTITEFLKQCDNKSEVLLITFTAYLALPYFNRRENWHLFIDEVPQLDNFHPLDVHQNRHLFEDNIEVGELINDSIMRVSARHPSKLKRLLENPDDITKQLRDFFHDILNPNKDVFVDVVSWNKFESGSINQKRDSNQVYFLSLLHPQAFHGVTLLGANIEQSLLWDWFSRFHALQCLPHQQILSGLRFTEHPDDVGDRLKIAYLLPDRGNSKHLMKQTFKDGDRWMDKYDIVAQRFFNDERFLYVVNKDYEGALSDQPNATQIPVKAHGLNCYDQDCNIYFGAALNRPPKHFKMLKDLGFSRETIKNSTLHEAAYQAIMRTALRRLDSDQTIKAVVAEKETADQLVRIFNGAEVKWIGDDQFRKKVPLTKTQRNHNSSFRKIQQSIIGANNDSVELGGECKGIGKLDVLQPNRDIIPIGIKDKCPGFVAEPDDNFVQLAKEVLRLREAKSREASHLATTFHKNVTDQESTCFTVESYDLQGFINLLKQAARFVVDNKTETFLINSTSFNNTDPEGHRRQPNFEQSSMMILDFDGGDLSITDFENIFGTKAGKGRRPFVICNSFSRSAEQPNRFRVFMFYKRPAQSLDEHQAVYHSIVHRLENHGFTKESAELDKNCRTGTQSFWMPCTNRAQQDWYYFKAHATTQRYFDRFAIDPSQILKTAQRPFEKPRLQVVAGGISEIPELKKTALIDQYKAEVRRLPEGRHKPFYDCALKLWGLGLPNHEIEWHLRELEQDIGKTGQNWAKDAMNSLQKLRRNAINQ